MANNYNVAGKYFDINSANVNVAGLAVLKGSAPASDDLLYVSEGYTVTIESACSLLTTYVGDNQAGTAAVKTGNITINNGVTLTLYTAVSNAGLDGEGSTSVYTIDGNIVCNTAAKVTNLGPQLCKILMSATANITGLGGLYCSNTLNQFLGTFTTCATALFFSATTARLPASINGLRFESCTNAITDSSSTTGSIDWGTYLLPKNNKIYCNTTGTAGNLINIKTYAASSRYWSIKNSATDLYTALAWSSTTGIQALTDNGDQTLTASWNGATGVPTPIGYRIYIRDGAAPNSFGVSSTYFLCETSDTTFVICRDAANAILDSTKTYHVIVRCANADGDEDTNTTALTCQPALAMLTRIDQMTQLLVANLL